MTQTSPQETSIRQSLAKAEHLLDTYQQTLNEGQIVKSDTVEQVMGALAANLQDLSTENFDTYRDEVYRIIERLRHLADFLGDQAAGLKDELNALESHRKAAIAYTKTQG